MFGLLHVAHVYQRMQCRDAELAVESADTPVCFQFFHCADYFSTAKVIKSLISPPEQNIKSENRIKETVICIIGHKEIPPCSDLYKTIRDLFHA